MRKTLLSLCIAMASLSVFAAPARKGSTVIKLVNGTELKASLQGDEFLHYYLAETTSATNRTPTDFMSLWM